MLMTKFSLDSSQFQAGHTLEWDFLALSHAFSFVAAVTVEQVFSVSLSLSLCTHLFPPLFS